MRSRGYPSTLPADARKSLAFLWTAVLLCSLLLQSLAISAPAKSLAADDPACGLVPIDVEIILDQSGSMAQNSNAGHTRAYWAQQAAKQLVADLDANGGVGTGPATSSGARHRVGLTTFRGTIGSPSGYPGYAVVSSLASQNASGLATSIDGLSASGNTPFKAGMAGGAADMNAHKRGTDFGLPVTNVIVFISDGRPNPDGPSSGWGNGTSQRPTQANANAFKASADQVFSIGIGSGGSGASQVDLALMQALAKPNDAAHYANIVDSSKLPNLFRDIFSEIACKSYPTIETEVRQGGAPVSQVNKGDSVEDHAAITGGSGPVDGSVAFFVCRDASTKPDCSSGGTKVGASVSYAGDGVSSDPFTPSQLGYYCFRAEFNAAAGSNYLDTSHTNKSSECFQVLPSEVDLVKTADAASVSAGEPIGFTLTIRSKGPGAAYGVKVSDALPTDAGLDWSLDAANTTGTWSLAGGVLSFGGADGVTMTLGTEYTAHVTSPTTKATCGKVTNTGDATTTNDGTDTASADVTVLCPDIKVSKSPNAGAINAGDTATFTIKVENIGPGNATGVTVTDNLPAGLTWAESEADCSISGAAGSQVLTCNIGSLAAGAARTYTVSAVTSKANCGVIDNTATASATNERTSAEDNNTDSGAITVQCAEIDVTKAADAKSVSAGDSIGFTVTVKNAGDGIAYDVTATDNLAPSFAWSIDPSAGWTLNGTILSFAAGQMAAGASSSVHVTAPTTADSCGIVVNTATASAANDGSDQASAQTEVMCPDVVVVKTAVASPVNAGDGIAFDIVADNVGDGIARNVTLTDTLPTGIAWSEDSNACSITDGVLSCDFGDLANGASAKVRVSGTTTPTVCGIVPNTATVAATNEPVGLKGNNTDGDSVTVNCPDIEVSKTADDSSISAGDTAAFTIVVKNLGPGAASDVTLADPLPAGVTWTTSSVGCSVDDGTLNCDLGTLAAGASATVHVSGVTSAAVCGTLTNTAAAFASNERASSYANNQSTASVTVECPDLKVTKDADNSPISAGDIAGYTIKVENVGAGKAYAVTLTDTLPAGVTWSAASDACSITDGVLWCDLGTLLPGSSRTVTVSGETTAGSCGSLPNSATTSASNEPGSALGNNTDGATVLVDCPRIVITKSTVTPVVSAGDQVSFDIEVTNTGAGNAYGVTVGDSLPATAGISWSIDAANTTGAWSIDNGTLELGPVTLAGGTSVKVRIVSGTTTASCSTIPNLAELTYQGGSGSDDSSLVVECPDVTIRKTAANSPILAGQTASYTISAWNLGPGTAYDVVITDQLPAGVAWTVDNQGCAIVEGMLTCQVGTLAKADEPFTVRLSGPTVAANCGDLPNVAAVSAANEVAGAIGNNEDDASITVLCPFVSIAKTNDAEGKQAPGDTIGYELTLSVINGPIATMAVEDVLPADFGTPSAISDGGVYDPPTRTITWALASVDDGRTLTYDVVIDAATQGGSYVNTATITDGPCVEDCSDTSVVPVWRVAIAKSNNAAKPLTEGASVGYTLTFAVQNGPVASLVVTDTLPAEVVDPRDFSVAPVSIVGQVITWSLADVTDGSAISYTATIAVGIVTGSYTNVAVITEGPCVGDDCTAKSVVNTAAVEDATGTPKVTPKPTPPATDTLTREPGQTTGGGLPLILFAITGLVAVLGVLTPNPARVRRQRRRG